MPDGEISLANQIRKKVAAGLLPRVRTDKMLTGYGHIGPATAATNLSIRRKSSTSSRSTRTPAACSGSTWAAWACGWAKLRRRGFVKQDNGTVTP